MCQYQGHIYDIYVPVLLYTVISLSICVPGFHENGAQHISASGISAAWTGADTPGVVMPVVFFDKLGIACSNQLIAKLWVIAKPGSNEFTHDVKLD